MDKPYFQFPHSSKNWEKHSLRYRGTTVLNFLIDEGLFPNDLFEMTDWSLIDKIHCLKYFLLLIPDDTLLFSDPTFYKWGRKIMICDAFFSKFYQISTISIF